MHRAKKWFLKVFKRSKAQPPVPDFPDEVLIMIFKLLSTEDRVRLSLVSKRFRKIDHSIGNRKFKDIIVMMNDDHDGVDAEIHADSGYSFKTTPGGNFEMTTTDLHKLFKGATPDRLIFHVAKSRAANSASDALHSLLSLLTYNKLCISLKCSTDFSGFLLRFFKNYTNRSLRIAYLNWADLRGQNCLRLQEALQHLPRLEFLAVDEDEPNESKNGDDPDSFLLNGSLMLLLTRAAAQVNLGSVYCSPQELLEAFEWICDTNLGNIDVKLCAVDSATTGLLTLAERKSRFQIEGCFLMEYTRRYALAILDGHKDVSGRCTEVSIYKIDADGRAIQS